jgi:hypothetical protein
MCKYFSLIHKKMGYIFIIDNYNLLIKYTQDNNFNNFFIHLTNLYKTAQFIF